MPTPATEPGAQEIERQRLQLELQSRSLGGMQGELAEAVQRYNELRDSLPIGHLTLTEDGEIMDANLKIATWLGVPRPSLRGLPFRQFLNPFDAGRFAAHLEAVGTGERTFETGVRSTDGTVLPVQIVSRRAPAVGDAPRRIFSAITHLGPLRHSQHVMAEIQQEHDALMDAISHDLRSPLVTIGTYAQIVLSDHAASLVPEVKGMVQRIERAAGRMESSLRQLLAYSLVVREELVLESVSLEELLQGILAELRGEIESRGASIEVKQPLPRARGCPRLIGLALTNLIGNALKFTRAGEAPHVTISGEVRSEFAVLQIADRGIGIEAEHHERIFRVFQRLHGYSTYPGAGIGLAIVRRAVERMQGRVWVESEKDRGASFHLMLPKG